MLFSLDWISGLVVGIDIMFKDDYTNGAIIIHLGIIRIVLEKL